MGNAAGCSTIPKWGLTDRRMTIPGADRDTVYRAIAKPGRGAWCRTISKMGSAAGRRTIPKWGPTDRRTNEYPARITIPHGV